MNKKIDYESCFYTTNRLLHRQSIHEVGILFPAQQIRQSVRTALSPTAIGETKGVEQTVCSPVRGQASLSGKSVETGSARADTPQKADTGYYARKTKRTTIP